MHSTHSIHFTSPRVLRLDFHVLPPFFPGCPRGFGAVQKPGGIGPARPALGVEHVLEMESRGMNRTGNIGDRIR